MDPKDKPTIYNYGLEARDACLTEMRKSMNRFASLHQRESKSTIIIFLYLPTLEV